MNRDIKCPVCRKTTTWENNPWRPFCSERCKMIDFGDWANEQHVIAGSNVLPTNEEEEASSNSYPYEKEN